MVLTTGILQTCDYYRVHYDCVIIMYRFIRVPIELKINLIFQFIIHVVVIIFGILVWIKFVFT